jgi:phenylpropionate dioxygenase-like ring-hydroxylating dioxygenase large terminal subunit
MATSLQTRPAVSDGPDSPAPLLDLGARLTARQPGDRRFGAPIHAWYPVRAALARNASRTRLHGEWIDLPARVALDAAQTTACGGWRLINRFGLVWARPAGSATPPDLPSPLESPLVLIAYSEAPARADYDQAVLGLLDPAHVPMIHNAWWWRSQARRTKTKSYSPSPFGFTAVAADAFASTPAYDLVSEDRKVSIEFRLPSIRLERVTARGFELINLTTVTPQAEGDVMIRNLILCSVAALRFGSPLLSAWGRTFLRQDVAILERLEGRSPHLPLVFAGDPDRPSAFYFASKAALLRAQRDETPYRNPVEAESLQWVT